MSITLRRAAERFHTAAGWLDSWHTFSFAQHYDPRFLGFRSLRVVNDDRVAPGTGFGKHPHRDMEILSYVLDGQLAHEDSTGRGGVLQRGDVQHMSAGTGVRHSERNGSTTEPVHFLQIWLLPERAGLDPVYAQTHFDDGQKRGRLCPIAARYGRQGALPIRQDAVVFATLLGRGAEVSHAMAPGRHAWVQVAAGSVRLGPHTLEAGDGAALSDEAQVTLVGGDDEAEVLLFDLA